MSETTEQMIQRLGKTASRITPANLDAAIAAEYYFTGREAVYGAYVAQGGTQDFGRPMDAQLSLLTFCVLVLQNGFTVEGVSACASPENFDAEIGRKVARDMARNKIWPLLGYELKTRLAREPQAISVADVGDAKGVLDM